MQTVEFEHFPLARGDRVLDLGCGEGRHVLAAYLAEEIDAVGVDLCFGDLQNAQQKFHDFTGEFPQTGERSFNLSTADALRLPFADDTFDKVICSEVLEHIPDYRAALTEIQRVLKPGGHLCASVPRRWPEKICWSLSDAYHQVPGGHLRIFKARELKGDIESLGFQHYHRHWAHALHAPFWWLKCMFWKTQDSNWLVQQYHRLLVWDLMERPALTRVLERGLNPVLGKSVVLYFRNGAAA